MVVEPDFKADKELEKLVKDAREQFLSMQNSWWSFAKVIHQIRETEAFRAVADTFKDYCSKEFPTMNYETMTKFCSIVASFQDNIDHRIEKDPEYSLPAYESCYRLTTLKSDVVPKEEITKLKKAVLDGKMTYASLKDRIKEVLSKAKDRTIKDIEVRAERVEEQLLKDLGDEGFYGEDDESLFDDPVTEDVDAEEEEITVISNRNVKAIMANISARVSFVRDNLPHLTKSLDDIKISDDLINFAEEIQDSMTIIEDFLNKLEEVSNG